MINKSLNFCLEAGSYEILTFHFQLCAKDRLGIMISQSFDFQLQKLVFEVKTNFEALKKDIYKKK